MILQDLYPSILHPQPGTWTQITNKHFWMWHLNHWTSWDLNLYFIATLLCNPFAAITPLTLIILSYASPISNGSCFYLLWWYTFGFALTIHIWISLECIEAAVKQFLLIFFLTKLISCTCCCTYLAICSFAAIGLWKCCGLQWCVLMPQLCLQSFNSYRIFECQLTFLISFQ